MTIGKKLIGGYAVMLALLALVTIGTFYSLDRIKATYDRFLDVNERLVERAGEIRSEADNQVIHYRGILLYPDLQKQYREDLQADWGRIGDVIQQMRRLAPTAEDLERINEIARLQEKYEQSQRQVLDLAQQGKRAEALALAHQQSQPLGDALVDQVRQFKDREMKSEAQERSQLTAAVNFTFLAMGIISLFGLIFGLTSGLYLSRAITRQLRESINQLSSSASEILATTSQVASGAAETATAVSETTATVEEVKQTAQVASQKARSVSDGAQKTAQISQTGRKSVEDAMQCMQHIQAQMEYIAESIVRLSEQGQAIGEIIATVNDLAEQSNVLAVNAAIEAAKAGEHGKGFGVVAQEVKSLAEQSKQATAQVRAILGEIQKATGAAVLATEQGNKAVDAGVKQTTETGESIRLLAESIHEAAQAATQIAASSQQQMVGMDQVALAMENIKQASVQNVAGTKQAEIAAQGLHEMGQKLASLIASKAA